MANVYAIKTGNWSDTTLWNTGTLPTSADDVYANGFTVTIDQDVTVQSIRNSASGSIVVGGDYILDGGVTLTADLIPTASYNLISFTSSGTSTINSDLTAQDSMTTVTFDSATGALNLVGNNTKGNNTGVCVRVNNTGTVNIVGDIIFSRRNYNVIANNASTINITGDITTVDFNYSGQHPVSISNGCTLNVTGNIVHNTQTVTAGRCIYANHSSIVNVTGNVYSGAPDSRQNSIDILNNSACKVIGSIISESGDTGSALKDDVTNSYFEITGPIICGEYGEFPLNVNKIFLIPQTDSYFEFRDDTNSGNLPPLAPSTTTRLVSPGTVVDSPSPEDVRKGTSYSLGTYTGTLAVPLPSQVALGIATDDTTGTGVLSASDVWSEQVSNITTAGSIGERLKNASTVESTGDQLESFL